MNLGAGEERAALYASREQAFAFHERGALDDAEQAYREILNKAPADLEVKHAFGALAVQTGRYGLALELLAPVAQAVDAAPVHGDIGNAFSGLARFEDALHHYDRAIAVEPSYTPAHINRAHSLKAMGKREEALQAFEHVGTLWPQFAPAQLERAQLLNELGRPAEALSAVEHAASLGVRSSQLSTIRAMALVALDRRVEALASYDEALRLAPDYAPAQVNRAVLLRALGRFDEALFAYDALLAANPKQFEALANRSLVLADLGRLDEALLAAEAALDLEPERADLHLNRASLLVKLSRPEAALESYERALGLDRGFAEVWSSKAGVEHALQSFTRAVASCDEALALDPTLIDAHLNRGASLRELHRHPEALQSFEAAATHGPEHAEAQFILGCQQLLMGDFERGWPLYEWRERRRASQSPRALMPPRWRGEELAGKTLFLYADQGLGDSLQFSRYATLLEARGARVIFSVQAGLMRLLRSLSPSVELVDETTVPPQFDFHCPLASLPGIFGTSAHSIPASVPYLKAEPERIETWRRKLPGRQFTIAVCWEGRTQSGTDRRSFPLRALEGIASLPVRLISLQKGSGVEQLTSLPPGMSVETLGEHTFDAGEDLFIDSAAVMECVDLVISCDTSLAHLAGALGRPAWLALNAVPDWRWMLERADSPWYPSLRLYRERNSGEWSEVFERMRQDLERTLG